MNIVILGAGAIGSLFGALLSKHHNVLLLGKKPHVSAIQSNGLRIQGKTMFHEKISATDTVNDVSFDVDLLLLTVKSYDTIKAIKQAKPIISKNTIVLTFQNGLDNIEKLQSVISKNQILAG
ncbi:MAG: ketopantoate reductase family protein, partial [Thermoplasmatales archaeon]|nr:ketopantoate reductase family protein [Thermoplasmatales archaeon]